MCAEVAMSSVLGAIVERFIADGNEDEIETVLGTFEQTVSFFDDDTEQQNGLSSFNSFQGGNGLCPMK